MPVDIHGKQYKTVAERLDEAHKNGDFLGCQTEVLYLDPQVMVKATIITKKGTFTGISAADPKKQIEARTPVEVAETSAVGRALSFAGYAGSEIASADEMVKALTPQRQVSKPVVKDDLTAKCEYHKAVMNQGISKMGNPYWSHKLADGTLCFGKKTTSNN
jgi:hypothetical protein